MAQNRQARNLAVGLYEGSGANGPAASVTVTFGELMTNDERIE